MRKILLAMLLVISSAGMAKGQETTGEVAEQAKKEILKIEQEKVAILQKGGTDASGWWERHNAEDVAYTDPNGETPTKTQQMAKLRSGQTKLLEMKQYDHRIRIYANGTTAVVTYSQFGTHDRGGKLVTAHDRTTDVWVKQDNDWKRVVHHVTHVQAP